MLFAAELSLHTRVPMYPLSSVANAPRLSSRILIASPTVALRYIRACPMLMRTCLPAGSTGFGGSSNMGMGGGMGAGGGMAGYSGGNAQQDYGGGSSSSNYGSQAPLMDSRQYVCCCCCCGHCWHLWATCM